MAVVGRINSVKLLKRTSPSISLQICQFSTEANSRQWNLRKTIYASVGLAIGGCGALIYALDQSVKAYDFPNHPPSYPWYHHGILNAYDHASIRRGFYVYKNVCSACHSLDFVPFRRLINVAFTEEEIVDIAAEFQVRDGPNEKGEFFLRPGRPSDYVPAPYPNEDAAAYANNGAAPPDLSMIVLGRHGNEDYVFSLLNGYAEEVPAGVEMPENSYYNPYFHGSIIAMAPPLYTNIFEYDDGTPATRSQLTKDVATFLAWCGQPEMEKRKLWAIKANMYLLALMGIVFYICRHKWASLRSRVILYNELKNIKK